MDTFRHLSIIHWSLLLSLALAGCASVPYQYGRFQSENNDAEQSKEVAIVHGEPNVPLDRLAWVVGIPSRILPLHAHVNNHSLSPETADKLTEYLRANELTDVYVRVNQYDPRGEWH